MVTLKLTLVQDERELSLSVKSLHEEIPESSFALGRFMKELLDEEVNAPTPEDDHLK